MFIKKCDIYLEKRRDQLAAIFEAPKKKNSTQLSLTQPHERRISKWIVQGIQATTIYRALVEQFGFAGSYSSVRRKVQKIRATTPKASCVLHFTPGEAAQVDLGKGPKRWWTPKVGQPDGWDKL